MVISGRGSGMARTARIPRTPRTNTKLFYVLGVPGVLGVLSVRPSARSIWRGTPLAALAERWTGARADPRYPRNLLQKGGIHVRDDAPSSSLPQGTGSRVGQMAMIAGGAALVALAARRRSWRTLGAAVAGAPLIYRGATGRWPVPRALAQRASDAVAPAPVEATVTIERPRAELYAFWRRLGALRGCARRPRHGGAGVDGAPRPRQRPGPRRRQAAGADHRAAGAGGPPALQAAHGGGRDPDHRRPTHGSPLGHPSAQSALSREKCHESSLLARQDRPPGRDGPRSRDPQSPRRHRAHHLDGDLRLRYPSLRRLHPHAQEGRHPRPRVHGRGGGGRPRRRQPAAGRSRGGPLHHRLRPLLLLPEGPVVGLRQLEPERLDDGEGLWPLGLG